MWNDSGSYGGGGFLNNTFASPSADGGEKKKAKTSRVENLVPVTIAQIPKSGEEFKLGKVSVELITFVAIVRNVEMAATKVRYVLDDYTGHTDAVLWLEEKTVHVPAPLNSYVRVWGAIRELQGERHVMIFNLKPLKSLNDLTSHLLEVIDIHQCCDDYMDVEPVMGEPSSMSSKPLANSMMHMNQIDDGLNQHAPTDPQQRMVYKVISDVAALDASGVDVQFITQKLNGRMSLDQVRTITDFLLHEGFIFSTIDDEHFTITK